MVGHLALFLVGEFPVYHAFHLGILGLRTDQVVFQVDPFELALRKVLEHVILIILPIELELAQKHQFMLEVLDLPE